MEDFTNFSVYEQKQAELLNNGLVTAEKFINKNYLINIYNQDVVPISEEQKNIGLLRFLRIEKLVYDKKENINDKLISVYSALQNVKSTLVFVICSDGTDVSFYIGVRSNEVTMVPFEILEKGFYGNFPGSDLKRINNNSEEFQSILDSISTGSDYVGNVSSVTVIPSMRDENKDKFVQGLEKFIDTMQGEKYSAIFIARPVSKDELEKRKRGYEELYSSLSPYIKTSLAYGVNYSKAISDGLTESFSRSVNNSVSNTLGRNSGTNASVSVGSNQGRSMNFGIMGTSSGTSKGFSNGTSQGTSVSKSETSGVSDTSGTSTSKTDTETKGDSRTFTVEQQNKSVGLMLEKIDENLKRIKACEAYGVWECAAYFVADKIQTSVVAANSYNALMLGDASHVENSFVNIWAGSHNHQSTSDILEYVKYGIHPNIKIPAEDGYEDQIVTPANYISGKELPLMMGLPHKSISGISVNSIAEFGRNVVVKSDGKKRRYLDLGCVYHMGKKEEDRNVRLDLDSFTSHCFITGSTGSGKSNTTYQLLDQFHKNSIPFLVIEPAKGEYKGVFAGIEGMNIFSTNPLIGQMLKLNPFSFPKNIHILEHLDRLIEIFNACWEMYAAMPAILKDAVEKIYVEKGWDLLNSVYLKGGEPEFPTFSDLLKTLPEIINTSGYSSDTKGDYTGALVTRVASLTNGISGQIFCDCYDIPDPVLFDENTIVDLSRVGSSETKSLIMGILVLKLSEYRMSQRAEAERNHVADANSGLRHITVMEEAHNLLKRAQPGSGSNVVAKSVEMICNSIAEMRTYGEGFVIVDQSPTAVDIAAIKNTNTKIIMRLPEKSDCEAVGNAAGMNEDQVRELSRLEMGVAVVMQNNWSEAVLTKIHYYNTHKYEKDIPMSSYEILKKVKGNVVEELLLQFSNPNTKSLERLEDIIEKSDLDSYKKRELKCCVDNVYPRLAGSGTLDQMLFNIVGAQSLFNIIKPTLKETDSKTIEYTRESIDRWKSEFVNLLPNYIDLNERWINSCMILLLNCAIIRENSMGYSYLIRHLEGNEDVK